MSQSRIDNLLDSLVKIIVNPIMINMFYPYKIVNKEPTTGTGIFIKEDEEFIYILTCAHVIENKAKITVMSRHNKERVTAVPVGICFDKDVAIIKVSKNDKNYRYLEKLRLVDIDKNVTISQGDIVKAVGYPLAEENLILTSGVFSGFKKNFLQVDTPVNPGNSGGPLVNDRLEIVGIVSSKIPNNVATNVAYVIPMTHINTIKEILLNSGDGFILFEPKLGMTFMNANDNIYKSIGVNTDHGYYVKKVYTTSQFYNTIKTGDLILEIDGNTVDRYGFINSKDKIDNYKLHITDYYSRKIPTDEVSIKIFNGNIKEVKDTVNNNNVFNIKPVNYPYDAVDFEIFSGLILTELTLDHILDTNKNITDQNDYLITKYLQHDYRDHKILFVSAILQGSYVSELDIFGSGEIIKAIDNIDLGRENKTLESILDTARKIIVANTTGYIKFTSVDDKFIVVNVKDALAMEKELSVYHKYSPTPMTQFLILRAGKKPDQSEAAFATHLEEMVVQTAPPEEMVVQTALPSDGTLTGDKPLSGGYKTKKYRLLK